MLLTNQNANTSLQKAFESSIKNADDLMIASGYFGYPLVQQLKPKLLDVARKGKCKILLGMIFHSGLSDKQLSELNSLDDDLIKINKDSGIFISRKEYHGKIYQIGEGSNDSLYIGSSNFSPAGFSNRLECTVKIDDKNTKDESANYLNYLFALDTTAKLKDVNLRQSTKRNKLQPSIGLENYKIRPLDVPSRSLVIGSFDIGLNVDKQPASSLNLFFDKGRKNQNGKYEPRPWYEVEIGALTKDIQHSLYPLSIPNPKKPGGKSRKGSFYAYLKKGQNHYKIKMVVSADNGKNIASSEESGGRKTFGMFIKGQLEDANLLKEGDRITSDILNQYGKLSITLSKIDDDNYFIDF
ncbi:restriction endonuclease PLD domain-containing protein [Colwelliaceae bacterium BS250]